MKTPLFAVFLFLLFGAICCRPKEAPIVTGCLCEAGCNKQKILDDMYAHFLFEEGSYWVYEEENSGAIDTLTLYYAVKGVDPDTNGPWFRARSLSSYDGYSMMFNFTEGWSNECTTRPNCFCHKVTRIRAKPGDYVGEQRELIFPPMTGDFFYIGSPSSIYSGPVPPTTSVVSVADEYELNGQIYHNVSEFYADNMPEEWNQPGRLFLAKDVGLIRKELPDANEIWNLIDYDVTPF